MKRTLLGAILVGWSMAVFSQNVGVGISSPAARLHVRGGVSSTVPLFRVDSASTVKLIVDVQGNVGIGTASPAYKLDVSGAGRFTGPLTIGAYTLPAVDGSSGQVLVTDGAGNVTWQNVPSSGGDNWGSQVALTQPPIQGDRA